MESFWKFIKSSLNKLGYEVIYKVISPLDIGIPQNRNRIFILGFKNTNHFKKFNWPSKKGTIKDLSAILISSNNHRKVELEKSLQIKHWQKLLDNCKIKNLSSLSIVAPEMGATYPLDFKKFLD